MGYNENEIRKAINIMKPDGQLFEIRIIGTSGTYSGYFRSADTMLNQLKRLNLSGMNVYITLNEINEACYSRSQRDKFEKSSKSTVTTSDNDIIAYNWLMIDLDPKRPSGTSSSNEQLKKAHMMLVNIYSFLKERGFYDPLVATSGNGYHLLYKIKFDNSQAAKKTVERTLKTLDMLFSNDEVSVDTANFNPARICKLYGTMAQKGISTEERPHRLSEITSNELDFKTNDIKYIEELCTLYPQQEKPQKYNNYSPRDFDLESWLQKYNIGYRETSFSDGRKFILDCCPFDSNHKGKDACIFHGRDGRIGFHCFHASCSDKTWRDVRILYEPDAYERNNAEYKKCIYGSKKYEEPVKEIVPEDGNPIFYTPLDIFNMPKTNDKFVRTGINGIDDKLRGLKKGYVSVMSGLRASGKSSIISEIALECIKDNNHIGVYSGELTPKNFFHWMVLQAAGKGYTEATQYDNFYTVRRDRQEAIAKWMDGKFWLYNNKYGNDYRAVINEFKKQIDDKKLDILILDNMMTLNIRNLSDTKYDSQTEFVLELQKLAKDKMIHILFIAHPRKSLGFLRLDDISGTADLANAVDNAFIVHRVNEDFKRLSKQMFGWRDDNKLYQATNVIEIAKDRDGGMQDFFVPLYYETESKRLKNSEAENKNYGWNVPQKTEEAHHDNTDGFRTPDINENVPF